VSRFWKTVFWILSASVIVSAYVRFRDGLGAATNLTDEFPWGLWIGFDILVGVGLAAGGFVIAATVHIFQIKRFEPLSRPVILTAFLGYLLVIFALMFDIGRPYRIWHPLVMGNPHSVMFEVAMCVMLYTMVLALEFSPLVLSRLKLKAPVRFIHAIYLPLVVIGVLLSTLHQSSLGTLFVIVPNKLHALWYTSLLPVFFFLSAIAGGLAMVIIESFLSYRAFGKRLEQDLLEEVARIVVVILAVVFVWRASDLSGRGALPLAFQVTPESVMFWGEMGLGVILPMILFMIPRVRARQGGLFFAAMLTIMGFIINRLNISVTGFVRSAGVDYIPSLIEFAVTVGIVALGFALFGLAVQHLDVFGPKQGGRPGAQPPRVVPARLRAIPGKALVGLWGFLLVGFVLLGFTMRGPSEGALATDVAESPVAKGRIIPTDVPLLLVDGLEIPMREDSPGVVTFDHSSHVDTDSPECGACHAIDFAILHDAAITPSPMLMETMEEGHSCGRCHDGDAAFSVEDDCESCHQE
jgi:c(7)-type cytochrome triheme protein